MKPMSILFTIAFLLPTLSSPQTPLPLGSEFQVNSYTVSRQWQHVIGSNGSNGFVIVWESNGSGGPDTSAESIQGQLYDSKGATMGGEFLVNTSTLGSQNRPSVGTTGNGGFVVSWDSYSGDGPDTDRTSIRGRLFTSSGTGIGDEFQVNSYSTEFQSNSTVGSIGPNGFVVAWVSPGSSGTDSDSDSIQAKSFSASGSQISGEIQVNTYTTNIQFSPAVGSDGAGGFVVVWTSLGSNGGDTSSYSVQAQRYTSNGTPVAGQFQVNTYSTNAQSFPKVSLDGSGGFVVVWSSFGSNGIDTDYSVQAKRFASNGAPIANEFQVNTYTTNSQRIASVSQDGLGGFVVVWTSTGSFGTDTDTESIQGQRFASSGLKIGHEFQVNSYTSSYQLLPSASPNGEGSFMVAWSSLGSSGSDTDSWSIHTQRMSANLIFADGFEFGSTARWSATMPSPNGNQCADAFSFSGANFIGNLSDNTASGAADSCANQNNTVDEFIAYNALCTGTVTVTTCHPGTEFDTVVSAWRTNSCFDAVLVDCNDDAAGAPPACDLNGLNRKSLATFRTNIGNTYIFRVTAFNDLLGTGSYEITAVCD